MQDNKFVTTSPLPILIIGLGIHCAFLFLSLNYAFLPSLPSQVCYNQSFGNLDHWSRYPSRFSLPLSKMHFCPLFLPSLCHLLLIQSASLNNLAYSALVLSARMPSTPTLPILTLTGLVLSSLSLLMTLVLHFHFE